VLRYRPALLGVSVGALLLALTANHVAAQTAPSAPSVGLRSSLEGDAAATTPDQRRARARRQSAQTEQPGQIPTFGTPPSAGAGATGFVSTNRPRRRGRPRPPSAATRPMLLTPAAAASPARPLATRAQPNALLGTPLVSPTEATPPPPLPPVVVPVVVRKKKPVDVDPYEQVGYRVGAFTVKPAVEFTGGYDTNPGRVPGGRGSSYLLVAPELQVRSEWQRHELTANIRGSYTAYEATPELDRPALDAKVNGRIDLTSLTRMDLEARLLLSTDRPGSPDLPADFARLPIFTRVGGTVGFGQRLNRFDVSIKGTYDRTDYEDSKLTNGAVVSNNDQWGGVTRASYELTPGVKPFVEGSLDTRVHDETFDRFGQRRDSDGYIAKAGTTFELTRLITGEVAAGYILRTYRDPNLPDLHGLLVDASLVWTASGLTTVKLTGTTAADESVLPDVAGVLRRDAVLQVEHAFRRWLIGTVKFGYGHDNYQGLGRQDDRYLMSAALTYKLNRAVYLTGEVREEWLRSNTTGVDYNATIALLTLRWQP
jgi:hypothetical protein